MDHYTNIESLLNALILNQAQLKHASTSAELNHLSQQQDALLAQLLSEWSSLPDEKSSQMY